jgi:cytidylate kinase
MIITMDGPTASGKSTISRMLAQKTGYYYVGSGILYRALAYLLVNNFLYDENRIEEPSHEHLMYCLDPERFFYEYKNGHSEQVFFDGIAITPYLKDSFLDKMASLVSTNNEVRKAITHIQREIAADGPVVVEGRDAGSVVFPDADFKIFLTASDAVRAERWQADQAKRGNEYSHQEALAYIVERDQRDRTRALDPLIIPEDAIVVDTSELTIGQTVEKIMTCIQRNRDMASE